METITLSYLNHTRLKISAPDSVMMELREHFSFFADGYKFMPKYKSGMWDGKIRLVDYYRRTIPVGLYDEIIKFANNMCYEVVSESNEYGTPGERFVPQEKELEEFFADIDIRNEDGDKIAPRDYQLEIIHDSIVKRRLLAVSPTGSGKSLVIYMMIRWMQRTQPDDKKIVLIVPRTQLVDQMYGDFADYSSTDGGWDVEENCHKIYSGKEKTTDKPVVITTWQSMAKLPKPFLRSIHGMIGDEAHTFAARVLTGIMDNMTECGRRIGLTGSLKGTKVNELQLVGLFGKVKKYVTTKELMDRGILAKLHVDVLKLSYDELTRKELGKIRYQDEIKFLNAHEKRTNFIAKLALAQNGNTLIAFRMIAHGKSIYETLKKIDPERSVYYVSGETKTELREEIRRVVETEKNAIIVASVVFLTGVNIKNLNNIIFSAPSKSLINVVQSIGRGLRKSKNGMDTKLYDIVDDLSWKSKKNFALLHGIERLKIYSAERFNYSQHTIQI